MSVADNLTDTYTALAIPLSLTLFLSLSILLDSVLPRPLTSRSLVPRPVCLIDVCDLRDKWVVGVRIREHRAYRKEDLKKEKEDMSVTEISNPIRRRQGRLRSYRQETTNDTYL